MARPVAVDPHDRRRSPSQRRTSPSHPLGRTPGEKQCPRSDKPPGQTVNTADSARTMSGALAPRMSPRTIACAGYRFRRGEKGPASEHHRGRNHRGAGQAAHAPRPIRRSAVGTVDRQGTQPGIADKRTPLTPTRLNTGRQPTHPLAD